MLRDLKPWPTPLPKQGASVEHKTPVSSRSGEIAGDLAAAAAANGRNSSLRRAAGTKVSAARRRGLRPALRWPGLSLIETAANCQGCGTCRSLDPDVADVPELSRIAPRGGFAAVAGQPGPPDRHRAGRPPALGGDEFKSHADLCIHCKLCRTECPSAVDVSSLMLEAKAAYVEKHGLPPGDWVFSRIEFWARLGSRFPIITNFLLSRRSSRWLLERMLGVSRHRLLPRATPHAVSAARGPARGLTSPGRI